MNTKNLAISAALLCGVLAIGPAATAWGQSRVLAWKTQLGTSGYDGALGVAADSAGSVYITGYSTGSLGGANQGNWDALLAKYDSAGSLVWKTQLGTSGNDPANGVAVDSAGNAYITGYTQGSLSGTNQGGRDAFLAKYSSNGSLAWKTQLGSSGWDWGFGVALDSAGNAYIAGRTDGSLGGTNQGGNDAFLAKYDSAGSLAWKTQLGSSSDDFANGVAVDSAGNVYITGYTTGSLGGTNQGGQDVFLAKYSSTGSLAWKTQIGTSGEDQALAVAVESAGNAYITGYTSGSLGGTKQGVYYEAFLAKYDSAGSPAWKTQLDWSGASSQAYGVAVDSAGNAYITGSLYGSIQGSHDVFVAEYDSAGSLAWRNQLESSGDDYAYGMALDSAGLSAYIAGYTYGSLGEPNQGLNDALLVKYDVPEPATFALLALGGLAMLRRRK